MNDTLQTLLAAASNTLEVKGGHVVVRDESVLRERGIDALVYLAVFGDDASKATARWLIWETAQTLGIRPASIHELYIARGQGKLPHTFTTPAMNIRAMAYDSARAAFAAIVKHNVGAFLFEIARSEMTYTNQPPQEYVSVMLAAAIKEGFRGPVFIQGDHFQVNAKKYADAATRDGEIAALKKLMDDALQAGFYNIDIDTSTLVDLSKPNLAEQQRLNYELCAMFSDYIRERTPKGVTVSLGGEIGEVGQKNSDIHELRAFMAGYTPLVKHKPGISKISIQTGTSHGGVVLPDGTIADVTIDFKTLHDLSVEARNHNMGGAVQHGASTLPESAFGKFVESQAIEVHLATAFQTILFDHLPEAINKEVNAWLFKNALDERKAKDTDEQFLYKTRKKAIGPFKKALWQLSEGDRAKVRRALFEKFELLFGRLGVANTREAVAKFVNAPEQHRLPSEFGAAAVVIEDVSGLAD
ncbi:MAG: class II fructose-bisphosphate aldolase [Thermoflexales bacterium]|nr:class II fructose-bisphosphate aldolase [Thermoflexales bacterium]